MDGELSGRAPQSLANNSAPVGVTWPSFSNGPRHAIAPAHARLPTPTATSSSRRAARRAGARRARLGRPRAARAAPWVQAVRDKPAPFWAMESLLREYPISSAEGLALMRLAEALLRVPDAETAIALTADQLGRADFDAGERRRRTACWRSLSAQRDRAVEEVAARWRRASRACSSAWARARWWRPRCARSSCWAGSSCSAAHRRGAWARRVGAAAQHADAALFSYDMLGEGARTERDALRYLDSLRRRDPRDRRAAPQRQRRRPRAPTASRSSCRALLPRYEDAQRERVMRELVPRVWPLVERRRAPTSTSRSTPRRATAWSSRSTCSTRWPRASRPSAPQLARLRPRGAGVPDARAGGGRRGGAHRARARRCASWCGWSRARTGTARSSARRSWACRAIRCSRTSTTPTSPTSPARAR